LTNFSIGAKLDFGLEGMRRGCSCLHSFSQDRMLFGQGFVAMAVAPVEFGADGSFADMSWKRHRISEDFLYDQGVENGDNHFPLLPL